MPEKRKMQKLAQANRRTAGSMSIGKWTELRNPPERSDAMQAGLRESAGLRFFCGSRLTKEMSDKYWRWG